VNGIEVLLQIFNEHKTLRFLIPRMIFYKDFLGHISTFCKLSSQTRWKRGEKCKIVLCERVLEIHLQLSPGQTNQVIEIVST